MSFDLHMKPELSPVSRSTFVECFGNRPNYTLEHNQALYHNEDTDVHFSFEFSGITESASPGTESDEKYPLTFNMNYCRPSYFIEEAEPEMTRIVSELDLLVHNPQDGEPGAAQYDAQSFTESWLQGNASSYAVVAAQSPNTPTLPALIQSRTWQWNYARQNLMESLSTDTFVPRISIGLWDQNLIRYIVWADGIPTLIPEVDAVVCIRQRLAPRKLFKKASPDVGLIGWKEIQPLLEKYNVQKRNEVYDLGYLEIPKGIRDFFLSLVPSKKEIVGLAPSQVLDRELLAAHLE